MYEVKNDTFEIILLTAPTGTGKNFFQRSLEKVGYKNLTSVTTRSKRLGERNGIDYYFISEEKFLEYRKDSKLIEDIVFGSAIYGLTTNELFSAIKSKGTEIDGVLYRTNGIFIVEPNGLLQFLKWVNANKSILPNLRIRQYFLKIPRYERFMNIVKDNKKLPKKIAMEIALDRIVRGGDNIVDLYLKLEREINLELSELDRHYEVIQEVLYDKREVNATIKQIISERKNGQF